MYVFTFLVRCQCSRSTGSTDSTGLEKDCGEARAREQNEHDCRESSIEPMGPISPCMPAAQAAFSKSLVGLVSP